MLAAIVAAAVFGSIATIGAAAGRAVCAGILPARDGPPPGRPPYVLLVAASVLVGALTAVLGAGPLQIGMGAIVLFALVACWCSDALCGIVPDLFTLVPLAVLVLFALTQRDWWIALSAAIVFAPFAIAALLSDGHGMGWGDAKLVALCGAALGAPLGLLALAIACAVAAAVHRIAGRPNAPIAFAPYIAAATGIALPLGLVR